ncbi:MAG: DNA double-strand break repair nuclease NurA [Candidatus ainarchaeum sp.]|nr:DNA double-strand break repair nuclease NurA [Candidatus ainarchaeum sp.]
MYFDDFLSNVCDSIVLNKSSNQIVFSKLIPLKNKLSLNKIENFVVKVNEKKFSCKIAGVDSGFVSKKLHFVDLVLLKLGGVIFSYNNSILEKADYFPSPALLPQPILLKNFLEKDEEIQSISLIRLRKEIQLSIDIIKKFFPKYLFIDGSIVPQYQDKPRAGSILSDDYKSIIDLFEELYFVAQENDCTLISTIEDSRGKRFIQLIEESNNSDFFKNNSLKNCFDSLLLDFLLNKGERTFCFNYASDFESHPVLKDYKIDWAKNIFVFYLKASEFDLPLRIEFISKNNCVEKANEIASIVYSLSSLYKDYSYPSILIEADLRARLKDDDISIIYDKLIDKLGPKMMLRRNNRPFK